jgi:hypothetical protein
MRLVVVSIVGLLLAACDASPEQQHADVIAAVCECATSTPFLFEQCKTEIDPFFDPTPSDECMDCVYANSQTCSTLLDDCVDLCSVQQPQP